MEYELFDTEVSAFYKIDKVTFSEFVLLDFIAMHNILMRRFKRFITNPTYFESTFNENGLHQWKNLAS